MVASHLSYAAPRSYCPPNHGLNNYFDLLQVCRHKGVGLLRMLVHAHYIGFVVILHTSVAS